MDGNTIGSFPEILREPSSRRVVVAIAAVHVSRAVLDQATADGRSNAPGTAGNQGDAAMHAGT